MIMDYKYETGRIYAQDSEGKLIAEVTFPEEGGIAVIDHTFVDDSLRGQGVAGQLVKAAADQILKDGGKIAVTCPYAVKWFAQHTEYETVDTGAPAACRIGGKH